MAACGVSAGLLNKIFFFCKNLFLFFFKADSYVPFKVDGKSESARIPRSSSHVKTFLFLSLLSSCWVDPIGCFREVGTIAIIISERTLPAISQVKEKKVTFFFFFFFFI